jgi:hypothetical protein
MINSLIFLQSNAEETRRSLLDSTHELGRATAAQFVGMEKYDKKGLQMVIILNFNTNWISESQKLLNEKLANSREVVRLDGMMKSKLHPITSSVISACIPNGQVRSHSIPLLHSTRYHFCL